MITSFDPQKGPSAKQAKQLTKAGMKPEVLAKMLQEVKAADTMLRKDAERRRAGVVS